MFSPLVLYTPFSSQKMESSFKNANWSIFLPCLIQPCPWTFTVTKTKPIVLPYSTRSCLIWLLPISTVSPPTSHPFVQFISTKLSFSSVPRTCGPSASALSAFGSLFPLPDMLFLGLFIVGSSQSRSQLRGSPPRERSLLLSPLPARYIYVGI